MAERRCDLCGPVTGEQAALIVLGKWKPEPTGYLCPACQSAVSDAAKSLADKIDNQALVKVMEMYRAS